LSVIAILLGEPALFVTKPDNVSRLFPIDAAVAHMEDEMRNLLILARSLIPLGMGLFNDGNQDSDEWISLLRRCHLSDFYSQQIGVAANRTVNNLGFVRDHGSAGCR